MLIKKDGIYKTIDAKDYGIFQAMGFEKVVTTTVKPEKKVVEPEPIVEEVKVEEQPVLPKSKKKKKV